MREDKRPEPGGDSGSANVLLKESWHILVNRRGLIAGVTLIVFVLSALFSFTRTPLYKTSAVIQISPGGQINLVDERTIEEVRSRYEEFFATQQALLQSRNLAQRVSEELNLPQHPLFSDESLEGNDQVAKIRRTAKLLNMLRVAPVAKTQLIEISFITPEPDLSVQLTNTWAEQYVAYSGQSASGMARTTSDFLRGEIEKLQKSIKEKEALLLENSRQGDFVIDEKRNIVDQQLQDMSRRLTQVQAERAQAWAHYRSLQQEDAESRPDVLSNPVVQDLKREIADLERRHAELSSKFKESYPEVQRTRSALQRAELRLQEVTQEVARQMIAAARVVYETALHEEALLKNDLEQQRQRSRDRNTAAADYRQIKAELDNEQSVLEQLLRRHSATDLTADLGERQQMMVRLVDEALVPTRRYSPKHRINLAIGGVLGLVMGIGLAFLLHGRETSLVTVEDVRRRVALPYLGFFPRDLSWAGTAIPPASLASSESARFLALLLLKPGAPKRTILVTSSTEGEGKTFVSTQLAACLAQLGKKVLLVDANLRSSSLRNRFRVGSRIGLSSVLKGTRTVEKCLVPCAEVSGLTLMIAGPVTTAPAQLLGSVAMEAFLKAAAAQFDVVVLDSAPLLPIPDSQLLARKCDSIVLVTRSGYTQSDMIETAKHRIATENGKIAGVVLNDVVVGDGELAHADDLRSGGARSEPEAATAIGTLSVWRIATARVVAALHPSSLGRKSRRALAGVLHLTHLAPGRRNGAHGESRSERDKAEHHEASDHTARESRSSIA